MFNRQLPQKPLGETLEQNLQDHKKNLREVASFPSGSCSFLERFTHSPLALLPAEYRSFVKSPALRWLEMGVFGNEAQSLPAGGSAQTLPAPATGTGLKLYL